MIPTIDLHLCYRAEDTQCTPQLHFPSDLWTSLCVSVCVWHRFQGAHNIKCKTLAPQLLYKLTGWIGVEQGCSIVVQCPSKINLGLQCLTISPIDPFDVVEYVEMT